MELVLSIVVGSIMLLESALIGVMAWAFLDSRKSLKETDSDTSRKVELLEAKLHELENEKFNKIMIILEGFMKDIEFIKKEVSQLKNLT